MRSRPRFVSRTVLFRPFYGLTPSSGHLVAWVAGKVITHFHYVAALSDIARELAVSAASARR